MRVDRGLMRRRSSAGLFVLACITSGCSACRDASAPPAIPQHVLFITIDTLRADHVGCYGSPDVATPNMDRLAREGAIVEHASVHAPITRPSHVSIFTGLYPAQHGIRDNISRALAPDVPTMAEAFKHAGFDTAGFVSSIVLSSQSGLGRGFDEFSDRFELGADANDEARFLDILEKRGDVAVNGAIAWLEQHVRTSPRMFVWVHLYDPHAPYEAPEPYASRYADRPYDGEVAWSDELVGRLEAALTRLAIADRTLVVLTADHGEALGEHGEAVHGYFLYEATLSVPLLLRGPGVRAGTRISSVVGSVDLFPTVLELSGVPLPNTTRAIAGRSLVPLLRGLARSADRPTFAESLTPRIHYGWSDLRSIRDDRWKFILAPRSELYDLTQDPRELHDLSTEQPGRTRALRSALERHLADEGASAIHAAQAGDVPIDLVEKLGALGYVSGGASGPTKVPAAGYQLPVGAADPKDKVEEYKTLNALLHDGLLQLRDKQYDLAASRFRELSGKGIDSFESHYYYGQALVGLRRWHEAAGEFDRAIPRLAGYAATYLMLASTRVADGDRKGAIDALRAGTRAVPSDARLHRRLGELYRDNGNLREALAAFREAVAKDPSEASQWNSIGMILGASEELGEAERAFREAVQRDPREPRYSYNLGLTLEREHRVDEAAACFRKTLDLDPRFAPAAQRLAAQSRQHAR